MRQVHSQRSDHAAISPLFPLKDLFVVTFDQCCVHGPLLRVSVVLDRTIFAVQISLTAV